LSFFDEADEPRVEPRTAPRRRRPSGPGRRPPTDQQAILVRRAIAAAAILVVVILIVLGVHSCQVSARNSSLKDYASNVSTLNSDSARTGSQFFSQLSSGRGASNSQALQNQLNETRLTADNQLSRAHGLDVPDEMKGAQQNFLLTMQMRRDGMANIAAKIEAALGTTTNKDAVNAIAAEMARFYASDVMYKDYTTPLVSGALHDAGIAVGGANGITIDGSQFLPDLGWLTPTFIAGKLGAQLPAVSGKASPGTHGHSLDSVSVSGTTLQTGSTNTLTANPPPTFVLSLTNGGQNNEMNVVCKVTVSGTKISGQTTIPQTTAGQTATCNVPLSSAPPAGTYTVTATVAPVPGERNASNNSLSFPVTFQ
jgi:hypothetical protein